MKPKKIVWVRRWVYKDDGSCYCEWVIADKMIEEPVDAVAEEISVSPKETSHGDDHARPNNPDERA